MKDPFIRDSLYHNVKGFLIELPRVGSRLNPWYLKGVLVEPPGLFPVSTKEMERFLKETSEKVLGVNVTPYTGSQ